MNSKDELRSRVVNVFEEHVCYSLGYLWLVSQNHQLYYFRGRGSHWRWRKEAQAGHIEGTQQTRAEWVGSIYPSVTFSRLSKLNFPLKLSAREKCAPSKEPMFPLTGYPALPTRMLWATAGLWYKSLSTWGSRSHIHHSSNITLNSWIYSIDCHSIQYLWTAYHMLELCKAMNIQFKR